MSCNVFKTDQTRLYYYELGCDFGNIPLVVFTVQTPLVSDPVGTNQSDGEYLRCVVSFTSQSSIYVTKGVSIFGSVVGESQKLTNGSMLLSFSKPLSQTYLAGNTETHSAEMLSFLLGATSLQHQTNDVTLDTTKINDTRKRNNKIIRQSSNLQLSTLVRKSDLNTYQILNGGYKKFYIYLKLSETPSVPIKMVAYVTNIQTTTALKDLVRVSFNLVSTQGFTLNI